MQLLLCGSCDHATISSMSQDDYILGYQRPKQPMPVTHTQTVRWIVIWLLLLIVNPQVFAVPGLDAQPTRKPTSNYITSKQCTACHPQQFNAWRESHHAQAMLPATATSVRADFNNIEVSHEKLTANFQRRGDNYFVITQGINGKVEEYQIQYTFGYEPLQQYLVAIPGGRLQALPWAWDTQKRRWYYLQNPAPETDDWLHWTRGAGNWNSMCAACHSTAVEKKYDPETNSYATQWAEINVGCEACHGPGAKHVTLVKGNADLPKGNLEIEMGIGLSAVEQVERCGRCHGRRGEITDSYDHGKDPMMNHYLPEVLRPGLYHADGQINDEVFVYGSFTQSKMYQSGVGCSSCHEVHSGSLRAQGNKLCASCHDSAQYNSSQHHHHPEVSPGAQCVSCHMPGKYYMGVDLRHDHSLRVPRPDLSTRFGTPNACNGCHTDQSADWAAKAVVQWFGAKRQPHFSEILASATTDLGTALPGLVNLLEDQSQPAIVRATAAFWLAQAAHLEPVQKALINLVADPAPLVRLHAIRALENAAAERRKHLLSPLLNDPVRAVRIAVAGAMADIPEVSIAQNYAAALQQAQREHQEYMKQNADFVSGQRYAAMYHEKQQRFAAAKAAYHQALKIDNRDTASRVNLAHLHYRLKEYSKAEQAFKMAIHYEPDFGPAYYSLGLLLAELKRFEDAENYLAQALLRMPGNMRVQKNLQAVRFYLGSEHN